jgi:ankyrin repeat protein/cytochrome c5
MTRLYTLLLLTTAGLAATLPDAVMQGDKTTTRQLLAQRADVNTPQPDGTTALHWAARQDDLETADALLRAGANPNATNRYGITPLNLAATNASAPMADRLLKAGANPNAVAAEGETVLMTAARTGNPAVVKALLDHGATVNVKDTWKGQTALMWAAAETHPAVVKLLTEHGADVNARSIAWDFKDTKGTNGNANVYYPKGGLTPLLFAVRQGDLESVKTLVNAGADVNATDPVKISPLVVAINNAQYNIAGFLLEKGADPNIADSTGKTALYAAVHMHAMKPRADSLAVIQSALAHGANPNARLNERLRGIRAAFDRPDPLLDEGTTPFMRAARSADVAVMKLLLEKGADAKLATKANGNALMAVVGLLRRDPRDDPDAEVEAKPSELEAIKMCVDLGIDVNAVNTTTKQTALHAAAQRGSDPIVQLLVDRGARFELKDRQDRTPLDLARGLIGGEVIPANVHASTVTLLTKLGATTAAPTVTVSSAPVPATPATPESKEAFERVCSGCHSTNNVANSRQTRGGWAATVDRMVSHGARISGEDIDRIVDYLAKSYPKADASQ